MLFGKSITSVTFFLSLIAVHVISGITFFYFSRMFTFFLPLICLQQHFLIAHSPAVSTTVNWSSDSITRNSQGSQHRSVYMKSAAFDDLYTSVNGKSKHRSYLGNLCCRPINARHEVMFLSASLQSELCETSFQLYQLMKWYVGGENDDGTFFVVKSFHNPKATQITCVKY